ncbi:hypothetical protein FS749_003313 [Ceratobasidium sp. UAMH 11750]|nr:hypothetical protein FS749_003313 [Ceratobasidium sp. UAMH 11750]
MLRRLTLWHLSAAGTVDYDEEKSHLPGLHDANNWTRTSQRVLQLRKILHEWTKFLTPRSILGYSVETPNPQSVYPSAPTLVPTSMAHQNYPYLATRLQAPVSDLYGPNRDIANNNMFLYLEMTGNKPLPTVALNSHANWVVNEPGQTPKDGTLAIAKLYFFDRYLLPRLATINRDTALRAINADNDGYDLVQIEFHFELGKLFDKQSDPSLDQWKSTGKPLHWEFEHSSLKQSENLTAMAKLLGINGSLACYIKNELQVIPASNQIRIKGYTKVAKVRNANFINGGNYTYEQNWSITIELDSVEKAGLVAKSTVDVSAPRQEKNAHGHLFAQDDELHATFLRQQIQGALHLEDTIKSLNSVLGGAWDFYFPGTGVFVLKNPKFNMEGDLLAELSYVEGTGA